MVRCLLNVLRLLVLLRIHVTITIAIHNDLIMDNASMIIVLPMISILFPIRMTIVLTVKTLDATCKHLLGFILGVITVGVGTEGVDIEMRRQGTRSRLSCIPCAQWAKGQWFSGVYGGCG